MSDIPVQAERRNESLLKALIVTYDQTKSVNTCQNV